MQAYRNELYQGTKVSREDPKCNLKEGGRKQEGVSERASGVSDVIGRDITSCKGGKGRVIEGHGIKAKERDEGGGRRQRGREEGGRQDRRKPHGGLLTRLTHSSKMGSNSEAASVSNSNQESYLDKQCR